jgi:hypothetical protein
MGSGDTFFSQGKPQRQLNLAAAASYECPVCRHGQIQPMTLMDAYACNFCRHIFDVNLDQQTVHVVDGVQSMGWRWQGWRWQPLYQGRGDLTLTLWLVGLVLVIFPAGIVAMGGYVFPPLDDQPGLNWSMAWAIATLATHSAMVSWLLAEHYQFPSYVLMKIRLQRLGDHWPG